MCVMCVWTVYLCVTCVYFCMCVGDGGGDGGVCVCVYCLYFVYAGTELIVSCVLVG